MPRLYKTKSLTSENAALAYPLIQAALPTVSLEAWLAFIADLTQPADEGTGIIIVESKRGYIHGLFNYSVAMPLGHGKVLNVENFIALDTGDRAAAIKILIGVMEDIARQFGCGEIHTHLPDTWICAKSGMATVLDHLRDAGHEREIVKLSKTVAALAS